MKRKGLILLVAAFMMLFTLAGCGSSSPAGTYEFSSSVSAGVETTAEDMESYASLLGLDDIGDLMQLTLNDDGTCSLSAYGSDMGDGTWEASGNTISVTIAGTTQECELDGNTIKIATDEENYVVLKKK